MTDSAPGETLRRAREQGGYTQRALAARTGIGQPHIARIESGRTIPSAATLTTLLRAARPKGSDVVRSHRAEILQAVLSHRGTGRVEIFGSVARGDEGPDSDIDLLVEFSDDADLFDVEALQRALEDLLGREVDVVSHRSGGRVAARARAEAVPL